MRLVHAMARSHFKCSFVVFLLAVTATSMSNNVDVETSAVNKRGQQQKSLEDEDVVVEGEVGQPAVLASGNTEGPPCPNPENITHGTAVWDGHSAKARYACFQGFHLVGPPQIVCRYGVWYSENKRESAPSCAPITCNHPHIENGRLETGESVRYQSGQSANILCAEGFELQHSPRVLARSRVVCREDGSWSPSEIGSDFPSCIEKPCLHSDVDSPIENGSIEINGKTVHGDDDYYRPGSVALVVCHRRYTLVPLTAGKRVCRRGKWEGIPATCVAQIRPPSQKTHCPAPNSIDNGYYITDRFSSETPLALPKVAEGKEQYERGTIARYHCHNRYTLRLYHGQETYRCLADGTWSPKVFPVCVQDINHINDPMEHVMCPSPPSIPYTDFERVEGWLTSNGGFHGTILEYSCRVGYRDSRTPCLPTRRTCHAGQWIGRLPNCVPFEYCERPPMISHGYMKSPMDDVYPVLSQVRYECHIGYQMKGKRTLKCLTTGCWSPNELPECIREDLHETSWNSSDGDSAFPIIASLVTLCGLLALVTVITTVCLVMVCRRKGGHIPHGSSHGPAHWSTTVTVTPDCDRALGDRHQGRRLMEGHRGVGGPVVGNGGGQIRQDPDRMALIAYADGVQVTLPSYEEALRDATRITAAENPNGTSAAATSSLTTAEVVASIHNVQGVHGQHHPHQSQQHLQQQQRHLNSNYRRNVNNNNNSIPSRTSTAAPVPGPSATTRHSSSSRRSRSSRYNNENSADTRAVQAWNQRNNGNRHARGGEPDCLSDNASNHSIQLWQHSGNSGEGSQGRQQQFVFPHNNNSLSGRSQHSSGGSAGASSMETVGQLSSDTQTTFTNDSQRALAGSLGSYQPVDQQQQQPPKRGHHRHQLSNGSNKDVLTSNINGAIYETEAGEDATLIAAGPAEGSVSSVSGGETGSQTYSEVSCSKP